MADAIVGTGSYGRWQIVVDLISQDVGANTSYVRVRGVMYNDGAYTSYNAGSVSKSITGSSSWSGSSSFSVGAHSSLTFIDQYFTVGHDSGGYLTVSYTANLGATGTTNIGGPTSVGVSLSLPRIVQAPVAPTIGTVTRSSTTPPDIAIAVPWTPNPAANKPYDGQTVYVSIDGAAPVFVANVSGTASSYTYTSAPNHKYTFTVTAANSAGTASSAASNVIITTPSPLASLVATSISSGTIRLTLPVRPTPFTEANVVIEETHNGGAAWNAVATVAMSTLSASTTTTYDDTAAETGGTNQYRARVVTTGGTQGALSSTNTTSNILVLNTPPNAPTNLTPSGAVDASRVIRLGWTHNPSSDGAAQSSRKIEYSTNGGSTWTSIVAGNSTLAYYDWTPTLGSFTAGQTIIWQVATAGSQPGTYGAWSASQTLTLYGSLSVTLTAGNPPTTHAGGPMPVAWTSSATWGTATQAQYQVTMTDQALGQIVYDTGMVTGAVTSISIPSSVQVNAHTYIVAVTLTDNHQIVSAPATRTVTTAYLAAGPVAVTWSYDDQAGALTFTPTFSAQTSSALDDTVRWTLERSLDNATWTSVGAVTDQFPITDAIARIGAASWYRTVGFTALGVAGAPTVFAVPAADVVSRWGWLNFGALYQSRVRFGWAQTVDISTGRASDAFEVESNDPDNYPVGVFGPSLSEKYSVSGKLLSGAGIDATLASASAGDMMVMSKTADGCIFRDARGTWIPARVTDMKVSPAPAKPGPDEAGVSFTVERIAS